MAEIVCIECKYVGKPKKKKRGNTRTEIIGWMLFPLGLPYTLWRMFTKKSVCNHCGSESILLANSVSGQRLIKIAVGESVAQESVTTDQKYRHETPATPIEKKDKPPKDPNAW